ncbi:MAG: PhnD/SsuA/transferrin family substrate-binding protein [Paracoccaceae bacterium]|nr:PhnD/SsuA/transferrin family substrate-binding protein [Paracoccaceae bacterium]MDG2257903.1 PhnD/SsuA/transferrin family substrate-binding protein [Paracoccaceae bacterium]
MKIRLLQKRAQKILFMLSMVLFSASSAVADIELIFGTYAADKPSTTVKKFKPFLDHLSAEMGQILGENVNIKMKISKEYEQSIRDLVNNVVDFARFGPASYITAKNINPKGLTQITRKRCYHGKHAEESLK